MLANELMHFRKLFRSSTLGAFVLAAACGCRHTPPPSAPASLTVHSRLLHPDAVCPETPRVEVAGDSLVVTGLFVEPHAATFHATLLRGFQHLTLLVHTMQPGTLNMVAETCYRAAAGRIAPGRYTVQVAHMRHGVLKRDLTVATMADTVVTVPED
jgi:hypothetical protein